MALTTTGGDTSGFRQQGTMDWVALAQKPVQFSFSVLARYSKAGIDPLTVAAGQATCTSLKIPWKVQQEILERMSKLPCMALYGKVAWFGFGLKHALLDLTDRDGGLECLTLCGCLAESYSSFFGAQVLQAFCRRQNMPSDLLPGIRNWQALLKPCAGIFASSKFPNLIQGFARLLVPPSPLGVHSYEATPPDVLAQALILLTQVSSKHLENFTITGGIDCAWLAAFAEFVLGLRIEILTCDGVQEHCSSSSCASPGGKIQVTFLKDGAAKPEIEITRKCFILPAGRDLIKIDTYRDPHALRNYVRSPWTSILGDSFGKSAQDLLHDPVISRYFGQILVFASKNCTPEHLNTNNVEQVCIKMQYCPYSQYGDDLLDFAAWRLPELTPVLDKATVNREHQITLNMAKDDVRALEAACCCNECKITDSEGRSWCLLQIASTIVRLISVLSMTDVHGLNPIPSGVRDFYHEFPYTGRSPNHDMYLNVHTLFSTSAPSGKPDGVAIAAGGVCCFPGLLTDPKLPPILAATVTVIPGHIEYSGSLFERIEDLPFRSDISFEGMLPFELEPRRTFDLLVSETADSNTLQAAYHSQDHSLGSPCNFTVGAIIETFHDAYIEPEDYIIKKVLGIDHEENCVNKSTDYIPEYSIPRGQKLCLVIALFHRADEPFLEIHKTSNDFSSEANTHQLYPEYQRFQNFGDPTDSGLFAFFRRITYLSDCPVCIIKFFQTRWYMLRQLPSIPCRVTVYKSGQSSSFQGMLEEDNYEESYENSYENRYENRP